MAEQPVGETRGLVRGLGPWDAALVTIGSVLGTGIFITTGDMARALPHPGLILLAWLLGGLLTLAGALSYAELGALFPRAGGQYVFLKEAYGPVVGLLQACVFVSGGHTTAIQGHSTLLDKLHLAHSRCI